MEILFENDSYWIVKKPAGILCEQDNGHGVADLLAAKNGGYAGIIHRLDREVGGLMVYAKTPFAAAWLSELSQTHHLGKEYLAAIAGTPEEASGELRDLLFYNRTINKVFVTDRPRKGVKEAVLRYRVLDSFEVAGIGPVMLVAVEPLTGRTHQIRVQFACRGHAVLGDRRYGGKALPTEFAKGMILLACRKISIPEAKKTATFSADPDWLELLKTKK